MGQQKRLEQRVKDLEDRQLITTATLQEIKSDLKIALKLNESTWTKMKKMFLI